MIFSYHWLKELSGTRKTPERLAEMLMAHSFEVESVAPYEHGLFSVVVGKVMTVEKHPSADRLRIATVSTGKKAVWKIVCGAPNLATGQRVAVALPGARLPGGIEIKEVELRGVKSSGMICSAKELGLGSDHAGILVLAPEAPVGKDFVRYAGLEDTVLDVKILPDRSCDALSYRGLAREIAALEGRIAPFLLTTRKLSRPRKSSRVPRVSIKTDRLRRYMAILLDHAVMKSSPIAVQSRLVVSGLRPVNAFVDLTNYLMLETGQPVHAFDANVIPKGGIIVRLAKTRERLVLLDDTTLSLSKDDIVIADTKKPLALAGVMGGKHSSITSKTEHVLFEIASFDARSVRRTEKRHHLLTDAAYRYERGIDVERPSEAAGLLARYAEEWGIGKGIAVRDVVAKPGKSLTIIFELPLLERLLGTKIPLFQAVQYCSWLGLSVKKIPNRTALKVTIPARRPDLRSPEDLVEEIGRLSGYHHIVPRPLTLPAMPLAPSDAKSFERKLKTVLAAMGFDEVMTYSFYGAKSLDYVDLPQSEHLTIANPMNPDQTYLRSSLFPGLYRALLTNAKHSSQFSLFEFGSIHRKTEDGPYEEKRVGLIVCSPVDDSAPAAFLRFKGRLETLFGAIRMKGVIWNELAAGSFSIFRAGWVSHLTISDGSSLGYAGEVNQNLTHHLGNGTRVYFAELAVPMLSNYSTTEILYQDFSRFPLAHRDISLIGPKTVSYGDLETVLIAAGKPLLVSHELFDVFEAGGEKSFALHLSFGSRGRTLSSDEMDRVFENIVVAIKERLDFRLRM